MNKKAEMTSGAWLCFTIVYLVILLAVWKIQIGAEWGTGQKIFLSLASGVIIYFIVNAQSNK